MVALSIATHIPFDVLATYDDTTIATYVELLNEAAEQVER